MPAPLHRYRVTVTPVENGGLPCFGRCAIEFEQSSRTDWMRLVEDAQRLPGLTGDERTALVIAARLLDGIIQRHADLADTPLEELRAPLATLLARIEPPRDTA